MQVREVSPMGMDTYGNLAPGVVAALRALGTAVEASGLEKTLTELLKIRASQINRCAFCLQFHLNVARSLGVPAAKLDLVATWQEAGIYSERERAALAWLEALTTMAQQPVAHSARDALAAHFSATEVAHLTAAIAGINAWNRIAGGLGFPPPIPPAHRA